MSVEIATPKCGNCGAQLGEPEHQPGGERVYRCAFCGRVLHAAPTASEADAEQFRAALAEALGGANVPPMPPPPGADVYHPIRVPAVPERSRRSGPARFFSLVTVCGFLFMFVSPATCLFRFSSDATAAMNLLRASPTARERLGDDIGPAWVGCQTGSSKESGSGGTTAWSLSVSGSKGSGRYVYSGTKHNGAWTIDEARLFVGGDANGLDVLADEAPKPAPRPAVSSHAERVAPTAMPHVAPGAPPIVPAGSGSAHGHPAKTPPH